MEKSLFKAVIFDLDGTLLDTLADIGIAANHALTSLGYGSHPIRDYKYFVGDGPHVLAEKILPRKARTKTNVALLLGIMEPYYKKHWHVKTRPYGEIPRLLALLSKKNIPLCILSNKRQEFVRKMVRLFFPRTNFHTIWGYRLSIPAKPHPAGALKLARKLKIEPAKIVFVGDSDIDIRTAVTSGMYPVGALWGFRTKKELVASGAKKILSNPLELLSLF